MRIEIIHGSVLTQGDAEAIVHIAPRPWDWRSGAGAALRAAAGPGLERHCQALPRPIQTVTTPGFALPNLWIIHVGSALQRHDEHPERQMEQIMQAVLQEAHAHQLRSLAMPALSIGPDIAPPQLSARGTAQALEQAHTTAPYLRWLRICSPAPEWVPIVASALDEATAWA